MQKRTNKLSNSDSCQCQFAIMIITTFYLELKTKRNCCCFGIYILDETIITIIKTLCGGSSVGFRVSQRGTAIPKGGASPLFDQFSPNRHGNQEILAQVGGGASLKPQIRQWYPTTRLLSLQLGHSLVDRGFSTFNALFVRNVWILYRTFVITRCNVPHLFLYQTQ